MALHPGRMQHRNFILVLVSPVRASLRYNQSIYEPFPNRHYRPFLPPKAPNSCTYNHHRCVFYQGRRAHFTCSAFTKILRSRSAPRRLQTALSVKLRDPHFLAIDARLEFQIRGIFSIANLLPTGNRRDNFCSNLTQSECLGRLLCC